ncbi:hypothetical protein [Actinosynnema sp. NPDC020468]|uniref:LolA family protein n=1 Tax=Actinosynnema sp. NPDC020468 TaxID=3154488 RepID=UPI0033CD2B60
MNRRRVTVVAAAVGVVAGVAGLGVLAMPAGAGPAPVLPDVAAESLVESVLNAKPGALGGSVSVNNDLGLPAVAGIPQLGDGASGLRVWTDGAGKARVQLPTGESEKTFVDDGETAWLWDSAKQTVTKVPHGAKPALDPTDEAAADPVEAARRVVAAIKEYSTVSVDGTARVANRPSYELVLTPKPTEKTVLREVRVAVDSELRIPLRLSVLTNGTDAPAVQVGFSELTVGPQDASLFAFTPPAGAKVVDGTEEKPTAEDRAKAEQLLGAADPKVVGEGWDTVVVARVPLDQLGEVQKGVEERAGQLDARVPDQGDVQGLIKKLGKQVSGSWGSGTLITTRVGGVLLADDGRVAAGAVPEQVLTEAIGQVK